MHPALAAELADALPTDTHTAFLRACLYSGEAGADAWTELQARVPDIGEFLRADMYHVRRLGPLLFAAVRHRPELVPRVTLTVLRTAYLREELRSREYRRLCGTALSALSEAQVPFLALRGAALADSIYGDPAARHSHDLNILVEEEGLSRAVAALGRSGFSLRPARRGDDGDALILSHPLGLPVLLHSRLFQLSCYPSDWAELRARSGRGIAVGHTVSLPSPADALLLACYGSLHRERLAGLTWACDAYLLVQRCPDLDWERLLAAAAHSRTALHAWIALRYVATELASPIPAAVLARLEEAAERIGPLERDVGLALARRGRGVRLSGLFSGSRAWGIGLTRLRWLLLPSGAYLRWLYGVRHPVLLPIYYVRRLVQQVGRRLAGVWRRAVRPSAASEHSTRTAARVEV